MPLEGVDRCIQNTENWAKDNWDQIGTAFGQEIAVIVSEATDLCPVDTGRLRGSIPNVSHIEAYPDRLVAIVGAGTDYAVYVHEDLTKYHKAPTRAKFLEIPIFHHAPSIPQRIRNKIQGGYRPADVTEMLRI